MKQSSGSLRTAFTLIELLVIVAIIAIVAAMILPANHDPRHSPQIHCLNNQKQIALGFALWESDHNDQLPWQVSITNGGTKELISNGPASQFQALSNHLNKALPIFICPADKTKSVAADYITMTGSNISYFVSVDASLALTNPANTILLGDPNLQSGETPVGPGLFIFTSGMNMSWTHELHFNSTTGPSGNLAFADGHVERVLSKDSQLTKIFSQQNLATTRLLVP